MHRVEHVSRRMFAAILAIALSFPMACSHEHASPKARVNLDNGSDETWQFVLDGKPLQTLRPAFSAQIEITPGKHTFQVLHDGKPVDVIETEITSDKVSIINPGGLSVYELWIVDFSSNWMASQRGDSKQRQRTIRGERVVQADYGLLDAVPNSIVISEKSGLPMDVSEKNDTRTKLTKHLSSFPPAVAEAYAILEGNPHVFCHGSSQWRENLATGALKALGGAPHDQAIYDFVMKIIASPPKSPPEEAGINQTVVVGAAFEALKNYESEIPREQLDEWINSKPDTEGLHLTRAFHAARILKSR